MATKKPRITITLEPETYFVCKAFADVQGRSMSSVINEILTEVSPPVARVTSHLLNSQALPRQVIKNMVEDLEIIAQEMDFTRTGGDVVDALRLNFEVRNSKH